MRFAPSPVSVDFGRPTLKKRTETIPSPRQGQNGSERLTQQHKHFPSTQTRPYPPGAHTLRPNRHGWVKNRSSARGTRRRLFARSATFVSERLRRKRTEGAACGWAACGFAVPGVASQSAATLQSLACRLSHAASNRAAASRGHTPHGTGSPQLAVAVTPLRQAPSGDSACRSRRVMLRILSNRAAAGAPGARAPPRAGSWSLTAGRSVRCSAAQRSPLLMWALLPASWGCSCPAP